MIGFDQQFPLNVQLEKLSSNPEGLRTNQVIGVTNRWPEIGRSFQLLSEPLDRTNGANLRLVTTSEVLTADRDGNVVVFTTRNSQYRATITEEK